MSKTVGHVCRGFEQSFIGLTWRNGKVVIVGKCGFCGDQAFTPLDSALRKLNQLTQKNTETPVVSLFN